MVGDNNDHILSWKSKGLSDENIKPLSTSNNILNPSLTYVGTKTRVEFKGSCLKQDKILFIHGKVVNIYFAFENCLFGAVKLTKHPDVDQYKYSGYGIGFDRKDLFHLVMKLVEM